MEAELVDVYQLVRQEFLKVGIINLKGKRLPIVPSFCCFN